MRASRTSTSTTLRKVDDLTLEIPLKSPERAPLRLLRPAEHGDRPGRRDGLHERRSAPAPFMFESFTVGERSLCTRNPNYWDEGKPYVDEWEDISIDDDAARLNALLAGEIDMMSQIPFAQAKEHAGARRDPGARAPRARRSRCSCMAVDIAPFDDAARPSGVPAHRRPRRRSSTARSSASARSATTWPGKGLALLRRGPASPGAGPRAGAGAPAPGRAGEPDGHAPHVGHRPGLRRGRDPLRRSRPRARASRSR